MRLPQTHALRILARQRSGIVAMLAMLLLSTALPNLRLLAQTTSPATEPVFGIGDDEFFIGGWSPPMPNTRETDTITNRVANASQVLDWAHTMGIGVLRLPIFVGYAPNHQYDYVDTLLSRADTSRHGIRFLVSDFGEADAASFGNEVKFYLVPDSVPFKDWQCRFLYLHGGVTSENTIHLDNWNHPTKDQRYHRDSVSANLTIADSIVISWTPERTSWWSQVPRAGNGWCKVPEEQQQRPANQTNSFWAPGLKGAGARGSTTFVVVTGHLDGGDFPQADADSTVLWIDVSYDIGKDEVYYDPLANGGTQFTAQANLSRYCTTLAVRRGDLAPAPNGSWDEYQEVALPFDATVCNDSTAGPLDPRTGVSRRLNLRVRYAGNATVALRSIALRDATAQAVLGGGADSAARRAAIQAQVNARIGVGNAIHRSVIAIANDGEQAPSQAAATRQVGVWLQEGRTAVTDARRGGNDSLTVWLDGPVPDGVHDQLSSVQGVGRLTMIMPEFARTQDSAEYWKRWMINDSLAPYGGRKGAIREHNGGRFGLPELVLDRDSIEFFERQVQIRHLRQHVPDAPSTFPFANPLSKPALLAREQRKRLVAIPFVSSNIWIHETAFGQVDSTSMGMDRILEPAEIRLNGSIPLAMGARGLLWQILCHGTDFMNPTIRGPGDTLWHGHLVDWPIQGKFVDDTADVATPLRFYSQPLDRQGRGDIENTVRYTIDTFWTGYGVRRRALQQYNAWLACVGPELMKLRWRDAYSIHATRPISYRRDIDTCGPAVRHNDSVPARPLPPAEIINDTRSYSLSGQRDPDSATYVELGLFDVQPGVSTDSLIPNQMYDVMHAVIVNRRVFEPTDELDSSSRRDSMVALAGTRRIDLRLNAMKFGEYTFCRIRELAADTAPLPGFVSPRAALDTIVPADGTISIKLGPGRAALLRITYIPWDPQLIAGRLEFSNQRKIAWDPDQRRFHCVYLKPDSISSRFDKICYRRSRVVTDSTGSILWEGAELEQEVSTMLDVQDSIVHNRHMSLTFRRVPPGSSPDGTIVTVVWTGHRVRIPGAGRQVMLRTLRSPDGPAVVLRSPTVEVVDSLIRGQPDLRWGTPVVARADGSEIVAWSDSLVGIKAVARVMNNPFGSPSWWYAPATYTDTIHVSASVRGRAGDDTHGRYPSVPTFAHLRSRDSNVALAWEQPNGFKTASFTGSDIRYCRLQHAMAGTVDTLVVVDSSLCFVNHTFAEHRNPSVSQHQDYWREVQDVVTWEQRGVGFGLQDYALINVRSIFTETRRWVPSQYPDIMGLRPQLWGWSISAWLREGLDWLYPNVASITYRDSAPTRHAMSTIAHQVRPANSTTEAIRESRY